MMFYIKLFLIFLSVCTSVNGEIIARLVKVDGNVYLKRLGMSTFSERAKIGLPISNGDEIKVGERSFGAIIYIDDRSVIKIRENTKFAFMDTRNSRTVELEYGTLLNDVKKENRTKTYRIQTPVSVASVKGTQFAAIVSQSGVDQFICKEGLFEVLNMVSGEVVNVGAGQKAVSNSSGNLVQAPSSLQEYPEDPEIEDLPEIKNEEETNFEKTKKQKSKTENLIQEKPELIELKEEEPAETNDTKEVEVEEKESVEKTTEPPMNEPPADPFAMGLGIGSVTIDDVLYNQIALRPEINIGKVGFGLDLVLYVDNNGNIRYDEWEIGEDLSLLLDKILYIKYGKKSEVFWGKYGSIEGMTFGYGGLMNNYSNMMEFPSVRRVGLNTGVNVGPVSTEIFFANLKDISRGGTITGFRGSYTISEDIPLTVGFNYILDQNMFSGLKDKDGDSYPDVFDDFPDSLNLWNDTDGDGIPDPHDELDPARWDIDADGDNLYDLDGDDSITLKATPFSLKNNKAATSAIGFDLGYPILNSKLISLKVYTEYNKLTFPGVVNIVGSDTTFTRKKRSGTGITIPGLRSRLFGFIDLSMEYRLIRDSYVPSFFDQAYDLNRISTSLEGDKTIIRTKDMNVFSTFDNSSSNSSSGLYGSAGFDLFNIINFTASYANMKSDTSEIKSFSSFLSLNTENIPKISSASAYFQRNNDDNPFDFTNPSINTIMGYKIGYELSKGVSLIWDFRQFYRENGIGDLDPIKQTTIETSFNF